jgi:phosphopantothenoylcysteine decarboxylase/phosphopantothenate--cysteine ligase
MTVREMPFAGKTVVLGVTGSIACYKAADLASKLTQAGAAVDVILTESAARFVSALTFEALTGRPVYTHLWNAAAAGLPAHIAHVGLAERADLIAVVPATADTLARMAGGFAGDLLTITTLAARCPVAVAPAMDAGMYAHPAVAANVAMLQARGVHVIAPEHGRFASGLEGVGRLPETPALLGHLRRILGLNGPLAGRRVVVTAGGTREALDPVRYIGNRSSGRQGYAIAQAAVDAGAAVTLITTAGLPVPVGAVRVAVESAAAMHEAVLAHIEGADILFMAAAVADFRPEQAAEHKIKKDPARADGLTLHLARTPDILAAVKAARAEHGWPRVVVGFAAESEHVLANGRDKRVRKGLDLLAANDVTQEGAGFAVETNIVTLIDAHGEEALGLQSKAGVAARLVERAAALLARA